MAKDRKKNDVPAETEIKENEPVEQTAQAQETPAETEQTVEETADDGSVTFTKQEFEKAKAEIARMQQEIETLKANVDSSILDAQRIQAEFSNFRKRNASIRAESIDDGARETIKALLPVLDNFERAFSNSDGSPFAKGIEQIYKQLVDVLGKCGMEEIDASGQFDPNMHEAVLQDTESEAESGAITAVLQKGFRVKGKIIRHSMVKVKA